MLVLFNVLLLIIYCLLFWYRWHLAEYLERVGEIHTWDLPDFLLWFYGWAVFLLVYDFPAVTPICFGLVLLAMCRVLFVKNEDTLKEKYEIWRVLSSARRVLRRREVSPLMLEELKKCLSVWKESEKEYARLLATRNEWKEKVAVVSHDIDCLISEKESTPDTLVFCSYDSLLSALYQEREELEKMEKETNVLFEKAEANRNKLLETFAQAIDLADSYKKHDASSHDIMEHQKEIKHLLEKTHTG